MKKALLALLFTSAIGAFSAAQAADEGSFWDVGVGYAPLNNNGVNESGWGFNLGVGYNFSKNFGLEADFVMPGAGADAVITPAVLSVVALGYLPVSSDLDVYGKAGFGDSMISVGSAQTGGAANYSTTKPIYGAGVMFNHLLPRGSLRVGVDIYDLSAVPGSSIKSNYFNATLIGSF